MKFSYKHVNNSYEQDNYLAYYIKNQIKTAIFFRLGRKNDVYHRIM